MSITKIFPIVIIALMGFFSSANAQTFTLDFLSNPGALGELLDQDANGMQFPVGTPVTITSVPGIDSTGAVVTIPGLALTVTGFATEAGGVLNATTGVGLGINAVGGDDSDGVEDDEGELITFSFNQGISITDIDFSGITDGAGSTEAVSFGGVDILGTSLGTGDVFTFSPPVTFAAGAPIDFFEIVDPDLGITGNGVSLTSFTFEVVPEPGSLSMLGLGGVLMVIRRRR